MDIAQSDVRGANSQNTRLESFALHLIQGARKRPTLKEFGLSKSAVQVQQIFGFVRCYLKLKVEPQAPEIISELGA